MTSVAIQNSFTAPEPMDVPPSPTTEEESWFIDLSGYFLNTSSSGKVHLEKRLGSGSYGVVYNAVLDQERYAAKLVSTDKRTGDDEFFENEGDILKELAKSSHEHIVAYYGYEIVEDLPNTALFIFELATLGSVSDFMEQNGHCLSKEAGWEVSTQLCDGLAFLHTQGVYHRDIRADNLLLTGEMHVKIADFGLAEYHPGDAIVLYDGYTSFPPPEYYQDGCYYAVYADLWAATMTLIYMVTWEYPWDEANGGDNGFWTFINEQDESAYCDHPSLKLCREYALDLLNPDPLERTLPCSYSEAVEKYWVPL